ncbi:MAG: alpha/beta hydrolase family protein [Candidatus Nanoarchaeia archaeon]
MQKIEKVVFKNSRDKKLVGDIHIGNKGYPTIIMCHGFTADRHENSMFDKIAYGINSSGFYILKFDFSGSGESEDDSLTIKKQVDDLNSAINYLEYNNLKVKGLFGHSLGGLVCLKTFKKEIETLVLTAPVTNKKEDYAIKKFTKEQLQELSSSGYITKIRPKEKYFREKIIIDKEIIHERETLNQKELLSKVSCPVLIIHGDKDLMVPLSDSMSAMKYLPKNSKLEIIKNQGHDFGKDLDYLINTTTNWFNTHLLC